MIYFEGTQVWKDGTTKVACPERRCDFIFTSRDYVGTFRKASCTFGTEAGYDSDNSGKWFCRGALKAGPIDEAERDLYFRPM